MEIISDINHQVLPPSVATIGFFDGVHRGHRFLINQVKEVADKDGLYSALVTFPMHPRQVIQTTYHPQLLSSPKEKLELLETTQVDYCLLLPFTQELSLLSAREFMQLLRNKFNIHTLFFCLLCSHLPPFHPDNSCTLEIGQPDLLCLLLTADG